MERKKFTEQNRKAWNEATGKHQKARVKLGDKILKPDYIGFDDTFLSCVNRHGLVKNQNVAHLCCNSGRETISLKRMKATLVTGFDISDEAINEADILSLKTLEVCEFVRTDIYEIPKSYDKQFDLVVITAGALVWMPDLTLLFQKVCKLLKKGGQLLIYEIHPYLWLLDELTDHHPFQITNSYFSNEPVINFGGLDYIGNIDYVGETNYSFDKPISNIINDIISSGLTIAEFIEYPHDISECFDHLMEQSIKIPMCYTLLATKN